VKFCVCGKRLGIKRARRNGGFHDQYCRAISRGRMSRVKKAQLRSQQQQLVRSTSGIVTEAGLLRGTVNAIAELRSQHEPH